MHGRRARTLMVAGIVVMVAAAVTGNSGWSESYGFKRAVGVYHGSREVFATSSPRSYS
ncbi:MAG: hypothetical protein ACXVCX_05830 [Ktedonobacterales bacterium]